MTWSVAPDTPLATSRIRFASPKSSKDTPGNVANVFPIVNQQYGLQYPILRLHQVPALHPAHLKTLQVI